MSFPILCAGQTRWEAGFQAGTTAYAGDLNSSKVFDYRNPAPAFGLFVRRNLHPDIALRLDVLGGRIAGDETKFADPEWRKVRGFSFQTSFVEPSLLLEWDLLGHRRIRGIEFHRVVSPYVFAGPGLLVFKPNTNYNEIDNVNPTISRERILADREATNFSPQPVAIVGGGLKFDLDHRWNLSLEAGLRYIDSDLIDGVSASGNPDNRDWYAYGGLSLVRRLYQPDTDRDFIPNKQDRCPLAPGPRKMKGCPDADGDRITDAEDDCPYLKGVPSSKGCPDADGDTVRDSLDQCPTIVGTVPCMGCPDRDADGVRDADDPCPDNPGAIALKGCPDVDHDGIADIYDACPEQGGRVAANGCPDVDGDGIEDTQDTCPDIAGVALFKGCPDTDADGIQDSEDACPQQKGIAAFKGCSDTDADGIQDSEDACPNAKGPATLKGCPDADEDGIADKDDNCPSLKGTIAAKGCPELSKEDKKAIDAAVRKVQFETKSDQLTKESMLILDQVADVLNRYPNYNVKIAGHTDSVGNDKSNLDLSERRAARCRNYLIEKGVSAERLSSKGYGESKPITSNGTSAGRAKNRRVEFELVKV